MALIEDVVYRLMRFGDERRTQGKGRMGSSFPKKRRSDGELLSSHLDIFSEVPITQTELSTWSGGDPRPDLKRKVGAGGLDLVITKMWVHL